MLTGRDPGELGIYGFRNRQDYSYDALGVADSRAVRRRSRLGSPRSRGQARDRRSACRRPRRPSRSTASSSRASSRRTRRRASSRIPPGLRDEIAGLVGPYRTDVRNFRSDDRDRILAEIYEMTEQHFTVARHLLDTRPWDFFMMVEIGVDRIHHAFWRYLDPDPSAVRAGPSLRAT